ncbi:crotonase/enoyl-CoA hydratase family protein [Actinomycetes bacterium M1A6_2h]
MPTPSAPGPTTDELAYLERRGHVGVITINRPHALNAVNAGVSAALGRAIDELAHDPELRVGVVTGAGRAFCAGADLKALAAGESIYAPDHLEWGFAGLVQHFVDKPLIAAVNGFALGGGTEIVLACDLAVVSSSASLGLPEVTRGLVAAAGGLLRLPDQMPQKLAAEAIFTGTPISADTALRWGVINRVVEPSEVMNEALSLAETIASNAPLAVRSSKRIMHRRREFGSDWDPRVWGVVADEFAATLSSADAAEGPRAFAEKRTPRWTGE